MTSKSFAALWQRDHWRYALTAAGLSVAATALSIAPAGIGLAIGAAGWPLASIAVAGLMVGASWQALKAGEREPVLNAYAHDKAPKSLQDIADNLFKKAGLTCRPDVRLLNADMPQLRGMHRTVCVVPFGVARNGTVPILLGRQVAGNLSTEEMTAVLARAAARAMVRPHVAGPSYKIGRLIQSSVMVAGVLTMNAPVLALGIASAIARRGLAAQIRLEDELLADRNAMALYPHPTALASAARKVQESVIDARGYEFSWFRQTYRAWENAFFSRFFMRDNREAALASSYDEVKAFNTLFRLPADGRDVLPPGLHAAWQAERTPYFWEKVRLPGAAPEVKPLRDEWNKQDPAAPCETECKCKPPQSPTPPKPPVPDAA